MLGEYYGGFDLFACACGAFRDRKPVRPSRRIERVRENNRNIKPIKHNIEREDLFFGLNVVG